MKIKSSSNKPASLFHTALIALICVQMVNISVNTPNNRGLGFVENNIESVLELVIGCEDDSSEDTEASAGTVVCAEEEVVHLFQKNISLHDHYVDSFAITHKSSDRVIDLKEYVAEITPPPPKQA